jgi:hypothetical protein
MSYYKPQYPKKKQKGASHYNPRKPYTTQKRPRPDSSSYERPPYPSHRGNPHEHPIRDMFFATFTCLGAVAFAFLWWGILTQTIAPLVIGITASVVSCISVIVIYFKAFYYYQHR